ncbi:DMT family transporter [Roseateles chitosanitabidus]|jgi:drug/metabolite transporter (DMT)-like permease|uniref:DMT family transporter n=1 Tax=Roseateles chitosanitabidus TaxID=65048 RepID=UPI00082B5CEB|nr:DMT family transporter [Roseateles chitosanitabidus]MBO9686765.1 DMT family transporter [Roseateles chitosanitabidus]
MERKQQLDGTAVLILLGCCLLWGLNQVAAKAALTEIGPLWQAALRSGVAGLLVWGFAAARGIALFTRDGSLKGGLLAGLLFAAEFACIFLGLQYTTASRMVVFIYLAPFVVALGMPLISPSEKLRPRQAFGLLIAFGAVAFAFGEGLQSSGKPLQWIGDALGVAAALLWGGTTLAIRGTKLSSASAEKTLLYQLAISAVALAAGAAVSGEGFPIAWSWRLLGLFGFQAVIVSFVSYLLWFWLIRHYPATKLSSFTLSTPLFGLLAGALLLAEPITPRLMLALAGLAAGIVMVNR